MSHAGSSLMSDLQMDSGSGKTVTTADETVLVNAIRLIADW